jgi:hypothetical protein
MCVGLVFLLLALAVTGCGGKQAASPPTTAAAPATAAATPTVPTFTSALDIAACDELQTKIRIISQLVSASVEVMTRSVHPKQLAQRAGNTEKNLDYAATVLAQIVVPASLEQAQRNLVAGLRRFAGDFGKAQRSVRGNDIAKAAQQLVDKPALAKVTAATATINRACGA